MNLKCILINPIEKINFVYLKVLFIAIKLILLMSKSNSLKILSFQHQKEKAYSYCP